MRQYIKIRFKVPVITLVQQPDTSWLEETSFEDKEMTFPDVGDIEKTRQTFLAAYGEAVIIDMTHTFMTDV